MLKFDQESKYKDTNQKMKKANIDYIPLPFDSHIINDINESDSEESASEGNESDSEQITDVMDRTLKFPVRNTQAYNELANYTERGVIHRQIKLFYYDEPSGKVPRKIVIAATQQGDDILYGAAVFKKCNPSEKFNKRGLRTTAVKRLCLNPGHVRNMDLQVPKLKRLLESFEESKKLTNDHYYKVKKCLRQKLFTSGVRGNRRVKLD